MKLSEENQAWLDEFSINGSECSRYEYFMFYGTVEAKLLEMQQRIDELEKEKYNSIEAWNSKLEKLATENAELRFVLDEVLRIAQHPPMDKAIINAIGKDRGQSLAQHDKEVAVKAIKQMINQLAPKGITFPPDDPPHDLTIVWEVFSEIKRYAEQLQEQD